MRRTMKRSISPLNSFIFYFFSSFCGQDECVWEFHLWLPETLIGRESFLSYKNLKRFFFRWKWEHFHVHINFLERRTRSFFRSGKFPLVSFLVFSFFCLNAFHIAYWEHIEKGINKTRLNMWFYGRLNFGREYLTFCSEFFRSVVW